MSYDGCRLRLHGLIERLPGTTATPSPQRHPGQVPGQAARTIAALLTLCDQVIAPIFGGVRGPRPGRPPRNTRTRTDMSALVIYAA